MGVCSEPGIEQPSRLGVIENHLMIESIEIRNFRCFRDLRLQGLKRLNIVVGESGSGKTALLESIFLAGGGNPEIYLRLRRWRGYGELIRLTGSRSSFESLFRDLFFSFDAKGGARIRVSDDLRGDRILEIRYEQQNEFTLLDGKAQNVF